AAGQGDGADVDALDDFVVAQRVEQDVAAPASPIHGRNPAEILAALAPRRGPERLLDLMLRTGPYGDAFGAKSDGLRLAHLEARPHGIDLGPLEPRIPEVLRTPSGKIELAPEPIVADVERLRAALDDGASANGKMVLIGRRDLRSNNSWMHNLHVLVKGNPRCTAQMNPADAARLGIADGDVTRVTSRVGTIELPAEVTDTVMLGVDLHVLVGIVRPDADVPLLTGVEEEVPEHPAAARRRGAQQLDLGMAAVVDADGARLLAERRAQEVHNRVDALEAVLAAPVVDGRVGGEALGELVPTFLVEAAPVPVLQPLDRLEILERLDACGQRLALCHRFSSPLTVRGRTV